MGDFNQVEFQSDKLSMNTRTISGAYDFNIWRITNQLVDIPFKGPRYTWCNNRKGVKRMYERIDRALGSKEWFSLFPNTEIKHYPIQISDHAPIELDLQLTKNNSQKPYKLDACVLSYDECVTLIKEIWQQRVWGTPTFRVARKLSRVRQQVKKWALDKRLEWKQKWDDFDDTLEKGMEVGIKDGNEELYTKANDEGRASRNFILGVKDPAGNWIYDYGQVGNMFYDTFFTLYNPELHVDNDTWRQLTDAFLRGFQKTVSSDDGDMLNRPYMAKEVRTAVFQMGSLKSSGPDDGGVDNDGDPLSPYLFVLCMEALSSNLLCAQNNGSLKEIRLCLGVEALSHLFFADDVVFFLHDNHNSTKSLRAILDKYCKVSGQVMNGDKSGILFSPNTMLTKA
ncbi:uncharacterized protein LOC141623507 [Silene latifolia]|uniref:uncharacterized protein LOC141623507 n=1 Tax=Silene latifolia TaxID=37657 RepID=UPI003D76E376